jgi:hypothetical protein
MLTGWADLVKPVRHSAALPETALHRLHFFHAHTPPAHAHSVCEYVNGRDRVDTRALCLVPHIPPQKLERNDGVVNLEDIFDPNDDSFVTPLVTE